MSSCPLAVLQPEGGRKNKLTPTVLEGLLQRAKSIALSPASRQIVRGHERIGLDEPVGSFQLQTFCESVRINEVFFSYSLQRA